MKFFSLRLKNEGVHCQLCICPISVWKDEKFKTYPGDQCKLYNDYSSIRWDYDDKERFTFGDMVNEFTKRYAGEYQDMESIEATVRELCELDIRIGVMPKGFSWL